MLSVRNHELSSSVPLFDFFFQLLLLLRFVNWMASLQSLSFFNGYYDRCIAVFAGTRKLLLTAFMAILELIVKHPFPGLTLLLFPGYVSPDFR